MEDEGSVQGIRYELNRTRLKIMLMDLCRVLGLNAMPCPAIMASMFESQSMLSCDGLSGLKR
jgi:hypothetical protein